VSENGHNKDYKITQENIKQVRAAAENTGNGSEKPTNKRDNEELFYEDVNRQKERIEGLVEQIEKFQDPAMRSLLAESMEAVLTLHSSGLQHIFDLINQTDGSADDVKKNLLADDFIKGLLVMHGLHPDDLETRLYKALDKIKPYMDSHGGNVDVLSIENGVATLELQGHCDGCPSSATTLELGIKQAIEEECPDLIDLEVKGVADNPLANEIRRINQSSAKSNDVSAEKPGWKVVPGITSLANGDKTSVEIDGTPLIVCKIDNKFYAYRNECPGCGMTFDSGELEGKYLKCKLNHKFNVKEAGKSPNDPDIHLSPFPLLEENRQIKVAVG
jgi:Fe-S cluster biogenesis protein NfuA/nitrite reductase/ring-hydroxylating ferredoxin subunit